MSIDPDELKSRRNKRMQQYEAMMETHIEKKETKKIAAKKMQGKSISTVPPPHDPTGSVARAREIFDKKSQKI